MKNIYKLTKNLDIFGQNFNFKINSSSKSKTFIGGLLTIISILLIIGASYATGNDIYEKTKPIVSIEEKLSLKRPLLELNNKTFPISVILQDYDMNNIIRPNYFTFEVIYTHIINANATVTVKKFPLVKCQLGHFPNFDGDFFNKSGLGNYFCIDNQNLTISGYWDEISINYVSLRIRMCNNQTDGGNCAPKEEIDSFIDKKAVAWTLFFQDSIINSQVNDNEIKNFIKITYKNLRKHTYKMFSLYVREQELITDTGIILEDTSSKVTINIEHTDYDDSDITVDKIYCDMMIFSSNQKTIYRRKYIKVQNILADVGGLTKALFMISTILTYFISIVKQKEKLINNLFDLNRIDNNNNYDNPEKIIVSNYNFLGHSGNINPIFKIENSQKHKKLKFSPYQIIKMIICKCFIINNDFKNKINLYKKGEQSVEKFIDVCYIFKKIQDVNKLKLILFDDYQIAMFERLKKFSIDNPDGLSIKKVYEEALINRSTYLQGSNLSNIDKRLKEYINKNMII